MSKYAKGFNISEKHVLSDGPEDCGEATNGFHIALDKLLAQLHESGGLTAGGGISFELTNTDTDEKRPFRILLQQMDGQEECAFCNGTGIEGS